MVLYLIFCILIKDIYLPLEIKQYYAEEWLTLIPSRRQSLVPFSKHRATNLLSRVMLDRNCSQPLLPCSFCDPLFLSFFKK